MSGKFLKVMKDWKGNEISATFIFNCHYEVCKILVNEKYSEVEAREIAEDYLKSEFRLEEGYNLSLSEGHKRYVDLTPQEGCNFSCKTELVWEFEVLGY
ncbi:MAG: hypothetical protein ACRCX7_10015 [Cetobacterium sp.]|uniref:hypothetical protein n=1 Tax=Cetobacterium sp. TaxID=2071632 RepID=UPI003F3DD57E